MELKKEKRKMKNEKEKEKKSWCGGMKEKT